jgi:hypothetical protein
MEGRGEGERKDFVANRTRRPTGKPKRKIQASQAPGIGKG